MAETLGRPVNTGALPKAEESLQLDLPAVHEAEPKKPRQRPPVAETPKPSKFMAAMDWTAEKGSIIGNWVVDFALVGLCLISMAPEIWTAMVMVFLSFIISTFLTMSLRRRNKGLYLVLVILIGFFDISYYMAFLDRQHEKIEHPGVDSRLVRLQTLTGEAKTALDELLAQQKAANNRTTLDNLDGQIRFAQSSLEEAKRRESDYASGGLMALAVDPRVLAMAIPNALMNQHLADKILLAVVTLLFVALQWTLRLAMGITVRKAKASQKTEAPKKRRGRRKTRAAGLDLA